MTRKEALALRKRLLREAPYLELSLNQWEGGRYDLRGTDTRGGGAITTISSVEEWEDRAADQAAPQFDLIALGDIAVLATVPLETAKKWADREQLPEPVARTSGGRIWHRADIMDWLKATGRAR